MSARDMIEAVAMAIYCDGSYAQYPDGSSQMGANNDKWAKTSETQRQFCRQQARAAIVTYERLRASAA